MPETTTQYTFWFDQDSPMWNGDETFNHIFLTAQQQYANHCLLTQGYVFMNDVLKSLGLPRVPQGQLVGWLKDGDGDGYVDFGLERTDRGYKLNFNVDGVMYDKI